MKKMNKDMHDNNKGEGAMLSRRKFFGMGLAGMAALAVGGRGRAAAKSPGVSEVADSAAGFTMWQLASQTDDIGNSYVFQTSGGKVIVVDGGYETESTYLTEFLNGLGGKVDAWFVTHPHRDHIGALYQILADENRTLTINHIYHSSISKAQIIADADKNQQLRCNAFYSIIKTLTDVEVTDIQTAGGEYEFDELHVKILSVARTVVKTLRKYDNCYNNASMAMRFWDDNTSVVILGDAGEECGNLILQGEYKDYLSCDYLQMAHHGQAGCNREFYNSFNFHACLWPSPTFVWTNNQGGGFDTGVLKTMSTRRWMQAKGIKEHHVTCEEGMFKLVSAPQKTYDYENGSEALLFFDPDSPANCTLTAKMQQDATTTYTAATASDRDEDASVTLGIYSLLYNLKSPSADGTFTFSFDMRTTGTLDDVEITFTSGEKSATLSLKELAPDSLTAATDFDTWKSVSLDVTSLIKEQGLGVKDVALAMIVKTTGAPEIKVRNMRIGDNTATGIKAIRTNGAHITINNGVISVNGTAEATVYSIDGAFVGRGREIRVERGIYVVNVGRSSVKVFVD